MVSVVENRDDFAAVESEKEEETQQAQQARTMERPEMAMALRRTSRTTGREPPSQERKRLRE